MRASIASVGVVALFVAAASCSAAEPSFDAQRKVCEDSQAQQSARVTACTWISKQESGDKAVRGKAFLWLADSYRDGTPRRYRLALSNYDGAIKLNRDDSLALYGRCWLRATEDTQPEMARADCNKSLKARPKDAETLTALALVHLRLGDDYRARRATDMAREYKAAIEAASDALSLRANSPSALFIRGIAKKRTKDEAGGKADTEKAIAKDSAIATLFARYGLKP